MTEFTSQTVGARDEFSVAYDAGTNSRAECYDNEVLHALCGAKLHLSDSGCVGVICDGDLESAEALGEHLREWHGDVVCPSDVWGEVY